MKTERLNSQVSAIMKISSACLVLLHAKTNERVFLGYKNASPYVLIGEDTKTALVS
jgi:hypothetical protein